MIWVQIFNNNVIYVEEICKDKFNLNIHYSNVGLCNFDSKGITLLPI